MGHPAVGAGSRFSRRPVVRAYLTLLAAVLLSGVCAVVAVGTWNHLDSGGFEATATSSARADDFLRERIHDGPPDLAFLISARGAVDAPDAARAGAAVAQNLRRHDDVLAVRSYWDGGDPRLRSSDGHHAVVTAVLHGDENDRVDAARDLVPETTGTWGKVEVAAAGPAWMGAQATDDSQRDLLKAELLSAPVVLLVLVLVFRSFLAAFIPLVVAAVAALTTLALLRPLAAFMALSVFSTNLTAALGFGLTVDYCLFLITRYRHEISTGATGEQAVRAAMRTAGRAAVYSSITIAAAMAALLCFPIPFLRSMACAGLVVSLCAAASSCLLLRPLLTVLGHRLAGPGLRDPWRVGPFWRTTAALVTKRPAVWAGAALLALAVLLMPVLHLRPGPLDERILPPSTQAHSVADRLRDTVPAFQAHGMSVVIPGRSYSDERAAWERYARTWSRGNPEATVTTPATRYRAGRTLGPGDPALRRPAGTWLHIQLEHPPGTRPSDAAIRDARALDMPGQAWVGGQAARFSDTRSALRANLPAALAVIAAGTSLLLFLFTGSVFLPLKAVGVAALSMSACFGAVIWAFQDGHLAGALGGFTVTGDVNPCILLLLFCVAFGLSMDYETFLLARIQEEYRRSGDNRAAVATGIGHTGRLVTVAAFAVAAAMAGLATSGITLLKILGFGLTVGVLIDATLVRTILVPASMCLLGKANWWAPAILRRSGWNPADVSVVVRPADLPVERGASAHPRPDPAA
ncbi:Trehalose monomycolate exporter MmpL3 [Streptomyces sp. enrichment culture]|uniref:MMPL family transporter n=1 Tax=Streptomyces sp. enrichment culture TaxID=1795815 RepID=UPI003F56D3AB